MDGDGDDEGVEVVCVDAAEVERVADGAIGEGHVEGVDVALDKFEIEVVAVVGGGGAVLGPGPLGVGGEIGERAAHGEGGVGLLGRAGRDSGGWVGRGEAVVGELREGRGLDGDRELGRRLRRGCFGEGGTGGGLEVGEFDDGTAVGNGLVAGGADALRFDLGDGHQGVERGGGGEDGHGDGGGGVVKGIEDEEIAIDREDELGDGGAVLGEVEGVDLCGGVLAAGLDGERSAVANAVRSTGEVDFAVLGIGDGDDLGDDRGLREGDGDLGAGVDAGGGEVEPGREAARSGDGGRGHAGRDRDDEVLIGEGGTEDGL